MNTPKRYSIRKHPFSMSVELVEDENGELVKYSEIIDQINSALDEREKNQKQEIAMITGCDQ